MVGSMKNIFLLILVISVLFSCNKEDEYILGTSVSETDVSFTAIPGGAIMNYSMPDDSKVFFIVAKYKDFKGNPITVKGSYLSNSIELKGFIKEEENIPVEIFFSDNKGNMSVSKSMNFSTKASTAYDFFENLEVFSYWNGFGLKYDVEELAKGIVHIGHVSVNPITSKLDTLLIKSEKLKDGENIMYFPDWANEETGLTDVVVWTEDYRGNRVRKGFYEDVEAIFQVKYPSQDIILLDGSSSENSYNKVGAQYLFDGDTKGIQRLENGNNQEGYIFLSENHAVPGYWTIDLQQEAQIAQLRFYCALNLNMIWYSVVYDAYFTSYYPNKIVVYGSNDPNAPMDEWDELGDFSQDKSTPQLQRWCKRASDDYGEIYTKVEELEAAEPSYADVGCKLTDKKYRYIRYEILEVFNEKIGYYYPNRNNRVAIQELEVYTKKED